MKKSQAVMPLVLMGAGRDLPALAVDDTVNALEQHGAILFHGFPTDLDDFYAFASRFNQAFLTSPFTDRSSLNGDAREIQTVTRGRGALSLHFEYGNSPLRPDLLWFYCRRPPAPGTGGETLLCDGQLLFERLDRSTQRRLEGARVKFTNYLPRDAFDAMLRQEGIRTVLGGQPLAALTAHQDCQVAEADDGRVVLSYVSAAVLSTSAGAPYISHAVFSEAYARPADASAAGGFSSLVTWEDGTPIGEPLTQQIRDTAHRAVRGVRWRAGDLLMLDNMRVMHGRRSTTDTARDLVLLCSFSKQHVYAGHTAQARAFSPCATPAEDPAQAAPEEASPSPVAS